MPSIKQLKDEISAADYFNKEQKHWILAGIGRAEAHLSVKKVNQPKKIRNPAKASGLITLEQWEEKNGVLGLYHIKAWADAHMLDPVMISAMMREFRVEMMAKGKQYANFKMAFQTYLTKGYLSKKIDACRAKETTTIEKRGISL